MWTAALLVLAAACAREAPPSSTSLDASNASPHARAVVADILSWYSQLDTPSSLPKDPDATSKRTAFGTPTERRFAPTPDGGLTLVDAAPDADSTLDPTSRAPEERAALEAMKHRHGGTRADAIFPTHLRDGLHVTVEGHPGSGLTMRPSGTGDATRGLVDGLIVYPDVFPQVDAVYAVSDRIEEYLYLRSPESARDLSFDVELEPGLTALRTDRSGAGLEAVDAYGTVLLRAPMPQGIDAAGLPVRGRLVASPADGSHWRVQVLLTEKSPTFPVLLDPSWVGTGSMSVGRSMHTATLLTSGKVLVAGGYGGGSSAELYDPATGTFSATGTMNTSRAFPHTATLLADGKVLVVGGFTTASSAELYDPATGTFAPTGGLTQPRTYQTAHLLPSGKVLIVGGYFSNPVGVTEVYDPSLGTFATVGAMTSPRWLHTSTLLASGQVLVTGGEAVWAGPQLASAELFDPTSGTFSSTGSLVTARSTHQATRLANGKVLVAGGYTIGYVMQSSAEIYDPTAGTFAATGAMSTPRNEFAVTLLPSGQVLVAGGWSGGGWLSSAQLYEPATGIFTSVAPLPTARRRSTATMLPTGQVLFTGGDNGSNLSEARLFNPQTPGFSSTGSLAGIRSDHSSTLLPNGKVLVAGGADPNAVDRAELYDPATGTFTATGSMVVARQGHTATLLRTGKVLIAGGIDASAELYDPATGTFALTGPMTTIRAGHDAVLLGTGEVLLTGGGGGPSSAAADLYDPVTGTFSATGPMNVERYDHTATLLPSGKVLVAGGRNTTVGLLASAEVYDRTLGMFTLVGPMNHGRFWHTDTLLPSGKVLVTGGSSAGNTTELFDPSTATFSLTGSMAHARYLQSAVLLSSGRVLVVGGYDGTARADAEVYDPATGLFSPGGTLTGPRFDPTTTLLTNGQVLVAGGVDLIGGNFPRVATAELFDEGIGYADSDRPIVESVDGAFEPGGVLTIAGAGFLGRGEGASGTSQGSATNHPLVRILRDDNQQLSFAPTSGPSGAWLDTLVQAQLPADLLPGNYQLFVVTSGIPSMSVPLSIPPFLVQHTLTVNTSGSGAGTVSSTPSGLAFDYPTTSTGSADFDSDTTVTLTATGTAGTTASWSGCDSTGGTTTAATCDVLLSSARSVSVTFAAPGAPGRVTDFVASAGDQSATVGWIDPSDESFDRVRIYRSTVRHMADSGDTFDQTQVYEGDASNVTNGGLTNGTRYFYSIFAVDIFGQSSPVETATVVPGAPTTIFAENFNTCGTTTTVPLNAATWFVNGTEFGCKGQKARSESAGVMALARTGIQTETDVRVRLLLTPGASMSGVIARANRDGTHAYALRLHDTGLLELVRLDMGVATVFDATTLSLTPGALVSLRLTVNRGTPVLLHADADGVPVLSGQDDSPARLFSGNAGLLSGSTLRTQYDDFAVVIPALPPAVAADNFNTCNSLTEIGPGWTVSGRMYCIDGKPRGESVGATGLWTSSVPVDTTVRARVNLGSAGNESGVMVRAAGPSWFAARLTAGGTVEIVQHDDTTTTVVASAPVPVARSTFYRLGLKVGGSGSVRLEAELDGVLVAHTTLPPTFILPMGQPGLLSGTVARSQYDDFSVMSP